MNLKTLIRMTILVIIGTWVVVTIQEKSAPLIKEYKIARKFKQQYKVADNGKFKLLMIWAHGLGEHELITRYKIVAEKLGIEYRAVATAYRENAEEYYVDNYAARYNTSLPQMAIETMRPDLIVTVQHSIPPYPGAPNYRVMDVNFASYIINDPEGKAKFHNQQLYKFDGYLTAFTEIEKIKEICDAQGKEFYGMNWYPTSYVNDYKPAEPTKLFYMGGEYGIRNAEKYATVIKMLDKQNYLDVAAAPLEWKKDLKNLRPRIPFDGKSLIAEMNRDGISLNLHDQAHLDGAVPTGRIFEAAAANTVIISDNNGFVKKHFGDNVLYVDVMQDAKSIFNQIDKHMQWIFAHPEQAKQMAEACHQIFLEKFTLEAQLQKLIAMHNNRIKQQKNSSILAKDVTVHEEKELNITNLPQRIRDFLTKSSNKDVHVMLVKIAGNDLYYHALNLDPVHKPRITNIVNALQMVMQQNKYKIPQAYYLVSYDDGVHGSNSLPILAFSSTRDLIKNKQVVLMPDFEALGGYDNIFASFDVAFNVYSWDKKQDKIFWRGSATGFYKDENQLKFPRKDFIEHIQNLDFVDAGFTILPEYLPSELLAEMKSKFKPKEITLPQDALAYKYLIDIDGNACSYSRMAWILYSNSLLMKHQSDRVQWYYDQLLPYKHYIPINNDFSNLTTQYHWAQTHEKQVRKIIKNAQLKAKHIFERSSLLEATAMAFTNYYELTKLDISS